MKWSLLSLVGALAIVSWDLYPAAAEGPTPVPTSRETAACLACHERYTPGIVRDWRTSLHGKVTPSQALRKDAVTRRISVVGLPERFAAIAVGCYECHALNGEDHRDNFRHNGFRINLVVTPRDCRLCHPLEVDQYSPSKKAHAYGNLLKNPIYHGMVRTLTGVQQVNGGRVLQAEPSQTTLTDTCLGCHGAALEVKGLKKIRTPLGEMTVPEIAQWPNQGVGRVNPDGSTGTCTACHPRHSFSIEIARRPATCGQCHLDPDVPAYNVYNASKHGNIFTSIGGRWDFSAVPWKVGEDFTAPTCAVCHNSLLVRPDGTRIVERTHDFGARLWVRLFGLPYSHPQPRSGDTSIIRNVDNQPLPTALTGEPASAFLIGPDEQGLRRAEMVGICTNCHGRSWVEGHFSRLSATIAETDAMTLASAKLLLDAWATGDADRSNPFDEEIERIWMRQWLFYGNSIRYASAMTGAFDYASFKNGWWNLTEGMQLILNRTRGRRSSHPGGIAP